jgi:hypothetical protein
LTKGAIDVQICPTNSNLISYVLNDNLWVQDLITKRYFQLTNTLNPIKSGVPSYAVQEEFNRYTGYWWQPVEQVNPNDSSCTYRIVYEEIDDSGVDSYIRTRFFSSIQVRVEYRTQYPTHTRKTRLFPSIILDTHLKNSIFLSFLLDTHSKNLIFSSFLNTFKY